MAIKAPVVKDVESRSNLEILAPERYARTLAALQREYVGPVICRPGSANRPNGTEPDQYRAQGFEWHGASRSGSPSCNTANLLQSVNFLAISHHCHNQPKPRSKNRAQGGQGHVNANSSTMSTLNENIDLLLAPTVLRTTIGAAIIGLALCTDVAKGRPGYSRWQLCKQFVRNYAAPLAVPTILGLFWLNNVNLFVPKPYMVSSPFESSRTLYDHETDTYKIG